MAILEQTSLKNSTVVINLNGSVTGSHNSTWMQIRKCCHFMAFAKEIMEVQISLMPEEAIYYTCPSYNALSSDSRTSINQRWEKKKKKQTEIPLLLELFISLTLKPSHTLGISQRVCWNGDSGVLLCGKWDWVVGQESHFEQEPRWFWCRCPEPFFGNFFGNFKN